MGESMQPFQCIMLYYFKKGENTMEIQKNICVVCREGAVTDWTCQKWLVKFFGTIDILTKYFLAVGLPYALEDV